MYGLTCIFWANLTAFSLQNQRAAMRLLGTQVEHSKGMTAERMARLVALGLACRDRHGTIV